MKNCVIYFLCLLCWGCGSQQRGKENKTIRLLQHRPVLDSEEILLSMPRLFAVTDNFMVLCDSKTDSLFHVVDYNKGVKTFGKKGQGPDEFLFPISLFLYPDADTLCLMDANKRVLYSINPATLEYMPVFYDKMALHYAVLPMKGGKYVSAGLYEDARFYLLDSTGQAVGNYADFPYKEKQALDMRVLSQAYMSELAANAEGDKFAAAVMNCKIISFYEVDKDKINLIKEVVAGHPDFKHDGKHYGGISKESPLGYVSITASDKHVYAMYSGKSYKEYADKAFQATDLWVYDWQGELAERFALDIPVSHVRISKDGSCLYAVSCLSEPKIVKFELPDD